jgi:beta-galactosidase
VGGVMKSALGYFEALSEMGVQSNFKEMGEFDFSKTDCTGTTIILAHQIAIPSRYWQNLQDFVRKGGKLIVDGLTGYYDENALCIMKTGFPLEQLFGGNISEFKMVDNLFTVNLTRPNVALPAHLWRGTVAPTTGKAISRVNNDIVAVRNGFGKGEVVWIPSLVGLGGRIKSDYSKLAELIDAETKQNNSISFRFKTTAPLMLMKTLKSGDAYITVVINKSKEKRRLLFENRNKLNPSILFADHQGKLANNTLDISPEETMVIVWK